MLTVTHVAIMILIGIAIGVLLPQHQSYPSVNHSLPAAPIDIMQQPSIAAPKLATYGDCSHLCGADGHCDSSEFFACLNTQATRFGVDGRQRTAFDPYGRRTHYDQTALLHNW